MVSKRKKCSEEKQYPMELRYPNNYDWMILGISPSWCRNDTVIEAYLLLNYHDHYLMFTGSDVSQNSMLHPKQR